MRREWSEVADEVTRRTPEDDDEDDDDDDDDKIDAMLRELAAVSRVEPLTAEDRASIARILERCTPRRAREDSPGTVPGQTVEGDGEGARTPAVVREGESPGPGSAVVTTGVVPGPARGSEEMEREREQLASFRRARRDWEMDL